ncbi:hypothetical protein BDV06DRAFT_228965 [Aspergillus oleicola]
MFFRAIIDDPKKDDVFISGIASGVQIVSFPGPVPTDPTKAALSCGLPHESEWTVDFRAANIQERDKNKDAGRIIGYCVHAYCWLLLGRLFGYEIVQQNLGVFVKVARTFWRRHQKEWDSETPHTANDDCWYDRDSVGLRRGEELEPDGSQPIHEEEDYEEYDEKYWRECRPPAHEVGNPLRNPALQDLIARCIQDQASQSKRRENSNPPIYRLPLEIQVLIVDLIYARPFCRERVEDMRNFLEAVYWTLPSSYWIPRCNPSLVFEVQDLVDGGKPVDWAALCLGLEELHLNPNWYCNSGLNHRRRVLEWMGELKPMFLAEIP